MSRLQSDPGRLADLERVLERRKREGRSSISRSGSDAGSGVLGPVVPAQFPPSQDQQQPRPGGHHSHLGRDGARQSPRGSPAVPSNFNSSAYHQNGQGSVPERLSAYADSRDYDRASEHLRASNVAVEQDELERQRRELLMVKAETKRELEVQRAIAAESENELRWQQQRLEDQLSNEREISDKWQSVQDRLKAREMRTAAQEELASRRLDAKDEEITHRLREREALRGPSPEQARHSPPPPQPMEAGPTPEAYRAMQQQIQDLERKVTAAMAGSGGGSPRSPRGPSVDPYDVAIRADSPHSQTTTVADNSYMQPGHTRHAPRAVSQPLTNPPPVPKVSQGDPIFSQARSASPTQVFSQGGGGGGGGGGGCYVPPSTLLGRGGRGGGDVPYNRAMDRAERDPVWDHGDSFGGDVAYSQQGRYGDGGGYGGGRQYSHSQPPINASGFPRGRTHMPVGGGDTMRDASGSGSIGRDAVAERTMYHTLNRAGPGLDRTAVSAPASVAPGVGMRDPSPQRTRFESQPTYVQQYAPINQAMRREAILHDMKSGDWFIKWTKNDKPHRRWFYLNQKKMLLVWANTQTASILMSNNVCLQEVVSIRPEQLTEESPGNPGHPQVYYLMTIVTYKRQLQIACKSREKYNKWYEGLMMLTQQFRRVNEVAYAQAANPALSRVLSRQSVQQAVARNANINAAD